MKSILLSATILLLASISLFSQEEDKAKYSKFSFGTELGVMYGTPIGPSDKGSTISVGTFPNDTLLVVNGPKGAPGLGIRAGVFGRYNITNKIGVQLGVAYSVKRANYSAPVYDQDYTDIQNLELSDGSFITIISETFFNGNVKGEFNNKYLEFPLTVLYRMSEKWTVHGGGYSAVLLSGSHKVRATGIVGSNFLEIENQFSDESDSIAKWDHGVNLGVSYKILKQLEAEFRISTGLRSIFSDDYQLAEDTIRNVYMELKANYVFGF